LAVLLSAETGEGVADLVTAIEDGFFARARILMVPIAPEEGQARAWLHGHGDVLEETVDPAGTSALTVRLQSGPAGQFAARWPEIYARRT
ncbi:MAG: GTPase HflX, partial [Pseudomonadota bacterium]